MICWKMKETENEMILLSKSTLKKAIKPKKNEYRLPAPQSQPRKLKSEWTIETNMKKDDCTCTEDEGILNKFKNKNWKILMKEHATKWKNTKMQINKRSCNRLKHEQTRKVWVTLKKR